LLGLKSNFSGFWWYETNRSSKRGFT
jgi:hypothetical protein